MKNIDFKAILMKVGGTGAGAIGANAVYKIMPSTMRPLFKGGILIVAGAVLPKLGKKMAILEDIGAGMMAFGVLAVAKGQFNLNLNLAEIAEVASPVASQEVRYIPEEVMNTVELAEAINGIQEIAESLSGDEDVASYYDEVADEDEAQVAEFQEDVY